MFGYVMPLVPVLSKEDQDTYKQVYCGLCEALGREYGRLAKLTLNYDFVFLALLGMALLDKEPQQGKCRCMTHPYKKVSVLKENQVQNYTLSCAMILNYYKCKDNLQDNGFSSKIKAMAVYPYLAAQRKKVAQRYPRVDKCMEQCMRDQLAVEQQGGSIDAAADATARFMSKVLEGVAPAEGDKVVLQRMGYLLGRYIYLVDAADDYEDDKKTGDFNPLIERFKTDVLEKDDKQYILGMIQMTIGEMIDTFALLNICRYQSILENILYLGLKKRAEDVLKIQKKGEDDGSI